MSDKWTCSGSFDSVDELKGEFYGDDVPDLADTVGVCWGHSEDYEGYLRAIFVDDGKWFEVDSSHCSCDGHSWDPKPITRAYVEHLIASRDKDGDKSDWNALHDDDFIAGLKRLLELPT